MKAWCFSGESVWVYDKGTKKSEIRNIGSIMGFNQFHSIKAGSFFTTQKALNMIFAPLEDKVVLDVDEDGTQEELKTKKDLNCELPR